MAERPIIFSTPMVRALLREIEVPGSGKTMTRRLAWRPRKDSSLASLCRTRASISDGATPWQRVWPGDVLWVRETWGKPWHHAQPRALYRADDQDCLETHPDFAGWIPSIHMPRWACRILLDVTAVKVERLQAITPEDALREGDKGRSGMPEFHARGPLCHVDWFRNLWTDLHGPGAWDRNPEVVAITFKPRFADQREHRT